MLYTQEQLVSYANYVLKENGIDKAASHAMRCNWEDENNIQPLMTGQEIEISTVDGLKITATINAIEKTEVPEPATPQA